MSATFNQCLLHKKDMFLLIVLSLVGFALSVERVSMCYGATYTIPIFYNSYSRSMYYKPRAEDTQLAVSEGKSHHKQFVVHTENVVIKDLTEKNDGAVVYFGQNSVILDIVDCQDAQESSYGDLFSWRLQQYGAAYIEFSQILSSGYVREPVVVWRRNDTSAGRGVVWGNRYELPDLRQRDSGYYRSYSPTGHLIEWKRLNVKEYYRSVDVMLGEDVKVESPLILSDLSPLVIFSPQYPGHDRKLDSSAEPRLVIGENYFSIYDVNAEDAGTFSLRDEDGFVALRVELNVRYPELPTWVLVVGGVGAVLFLFCCCCCVRKCCCKKSSNKRSSAETDAPRVFYHDSNQPSQPVAPVLSRERVLHPEPPTYSSSGGNVDLTPYTQVPVPGPERAPVAPTSSEPEPRFEFKGMVFPSAPPLSSSSNIQDVYSSDKLNFL